jgi:heparan-alpha-glucosaminide N-acetyltransferase
MTALPQPHRIASVDIVRALTMVLMIFVNDLWSLRDIPPWLGHVPAEADGMGLSDVVFPAFLFIVGMSIPFAVNNRKKKGETQVEIIGHVLIRSGALLIMGLFLVNGEYINAEATGIHRLVWNVLSCTAFILIWNSYQASTRVWFVRGARALGIFTLITLAILYRAGEPGNIHGFSTYWWGILGLIGWAYLVSGTVYTLLGRRFISIVAAWIFFNLLCMASHAGWITNDFLKTILSPIEEGAMPALTMGGVVVSMIYLHFRNRNMEVKMIFVTVVMGVILIALGMYGNTLWDISKIRATPPWILICSGLTTLSFVLVYEIADMSGKSCWFNFVKPAGTNTLLCYLLPHFAYATVVALALNYPLFMLSGIVGLIKSLLFALLIVWIAGWLGKRGIQLKL